MKRDTMKKLLFLSIALLATSAIDGAAYARRLFQRNKGKQNIEAEVASSSTAASSLSSQELPDTLYMRGYFMKKGSKNFDFNWFPSYDKGDRYYNAFKENDIIFYDAKNLQAYLNKGHKLAFISSKGKYDETTKITFKPTIDDHSKQLKFLDELKEQSPYFDDITSLHDERLKPFRVSDEEIEQILAERSININN